MAIAWSRRQPDGCGACGTRERKHAGRGLCTSCYSAYKRSQGFVRVKRETRVRHRAGVREHFCFEHEGWLPVEEFRRVERKAGTVYETACRTCSSQRRRAYYLANRDRIRERNRERYVRIREATKRVGDASSNDTRRLPTDVVAPWLRDVDLERLSDEASIDLRVLRRIADQRTRTVSTELADTIAAATENLDAYYAHLTTGVPGWSAHSDHCLHCGRFDRPHWARGLCLPCYDMDRWWSRTDRPLPPPKNERWTIQAPLGCLECRSRKRLHQARGLCTRCYARFLGKARERAVPIAAYLDSLGFKRSVNNELYDLRGGIAAASRAG